MPSGSPLGEMYIELGLDTSHFSTGIQSAKREINYFQAGVRGLDQVLKQNGKILRLYKLSIRF